jgi:hypothetical protein
VNVKKKQTKKRKSVRVKRMPRQRIKRRRIKRRRITAAQARRIAMLYDAKLRFRRAAVKSGREVGGPSVYGVNLHDCWIVYPRSIGEPGRVGGSYLICVDKRTGKVLYSGRCGE